MLLKIYLIKPNLCTKLGTGSKNLHNSVAISHLRKVVSTYTHVKHDA